MLLIIFGLICSYKSNTDIYIGNFSHRQCSVDFELSINDKIILRDTFRNSIYPIVLNDELKYGLNEIRLISNKANIDQEAKVFLLPNQHIFIEFLGADTLCQERKFLEEEDSLGIGLNKMKQINRATSSFRIENLFNPFYIE